MTKLKWCTICWCLLHATILIPFNWFLTLDELINEAKKEADRKSGTGIAGLKLK